jgi:hypothetical protein
MIREKKLSSIVKSFISFFKFPEANLFGGLYSVLKPLQDLWVKGVSHICSLQYVIESGTHIWVWNVSQQTQIMGV